MIPPTSRAVRCAISPATSPSKPIWTPYISQPWNMPVRTIARTAAFIPGASPPLVNTAIFLFIEPSMCCFALKLTHAMMIASASQLEENVAGCFEICFRMSHATRELKFPKEKVMKNDDDLDLGLDFDADSDSADADEGMDDEILL